MLIFFTNAINVFLLINVYFEKSGIRFVAITTDHTIIITIQNNSIILNCFFLNMMKNTDA